MRWPSSSRWKQEYWNSWGVSMMAWRRSWTCSWVEIYFGSAAVWAWWAHRHTVIWCSEGSWGSLTVIWKMAAEWLASVSVHGLAVRHSLSAWPLTASSLVCSTWASSPVACWTALDSLTSAWGNQSAMHLHKGSGSGLECSRAGLGSGDGHLWWRRHCRRT